MKKSFLIVGALGAILSTNGYAVSSDGVVISYTCPAGCTLSTYTTSGGNTHAACVRENAQTLDGYFCDGPEVVVTENSVAPNDTLTNTKKEKKARAFPARVASVSPNVSSRKTSTVKPVVSQEEEEVGSSTVIVSCPEGCKPDCYETNNAIVCKCKTSSGELCQEKAVTKENTIHGFDR